MNLESLTKDQLRRVVEVLYPCRGDDEHCAIAAIAAEPPQLTDRVLVVSHSPEVQELCDERIEVERG